MSQPPPPPPFHPALDREKGNIEWKSIDFGEEEGMYRCCAHADPTSLFPSQAPRDKSKLHDDINVVNGT